MDRRTFCLKSVGCTAGLTLLAFPRIITNLSAAQGDKSKEAILKELGEKADKCIEMYQSCSVASFAALNEQFKLGAERTIPALMPFTGGIALKSETCGAVSGSMLAIGYYFEPGDQKGEKKAGSSMEYGGIFFDRFAKEFSSTRCKAVQEHLFGRSYDFLNPEEQKLFMEVAGKSEKNCMHVIKKAVLIAGDIMLENS